MDPENEPVQPIVPATVVNVATPAPVEIPDEESEDTGAALDAIGARIDTIETRITEAIEGERTWTTQTITSLQQEIADLRATLQTVAVNLPEQVKTLREELTRLSLAQQQIPLEIEAEATLETPPAIPASEDDTPPLANASDAPPSAQDNQSRPSNQRAKRVI